MSPDLIDPEMVFENDSKFLDIPFASSSGGGEIKQINHWTILDSENENNSWTKFSSSQTPSNSVNSSASSSPQELPMKTFENWEYSSPIANTSTNLLISPTVPLNVPNSNQFPLYL